MKFNKPWHLLLYYAAPLFFAVLIVSIQFHGMESNQVLKIHDQYFPTSLSSALQNLSPISHINNGVSNVFKYVIHLPDSIFFVFSYLMGISAQKAEIIYMISMLYIGYMLFSKGIYLLLESRWRLELSIIAGTAFIASPFMLIAFNTGVYWSLMNMLAITLLPLALYFYLKIQECLHLKQNISCANFIWLGAISSVYLYSITYLIPYLLLLLAVTKWENISTLKKEYARSLIIVLLIMMGFGCPAIIGYVSESLLFFDEVSNSSALVNSAAKNINGGISYQIAQYSSWAVYTPWPRVFLSFNGYFDSWIYKIAISGIAISAGYVLIQFGTVSLVSRLFIITLTSLFLSKAGNIPFGDIYSWMLENIYIFSIVRSPDTKFGLIYTFAVLLICIIGCDEFIKKRKKYKALAILLPMLLVTLLSYIYVFQGKIIRGDSDLVSSSNFIQAINSDQLETANFLNSKSDNESIVFYNWAGWYDYGTNKTISLSDPLADFVASKYYTHPTPSIIMKEPHKANKIFSNELKDNDCTDCYLYIRPKYGVINKNHQDYDKIYKNVKSNNLGNSVFENNTYYVFAHKYSISDNDLNIKSGCMNNVHSYNPLSIWTVRFEKGCYSDANIYVNLNTSKWWSCISINSSNGIRISKLIKKGSSDGWTTTVNHENYYLIFHDLQIMALIGLFVFCATLAACIYRLLKCYQ